MSDSGIHVATVMLDVDDLDVAPSFWTSLLGVEEAYRSERFVFLTADAEGGTNLAFQRVDDPKVAKNRAHVDLHVNDLTASVTLAERLGATAHEEHTVGPFVWRVLTDPAGNEFCLVGKAPA